MSTAIVLTLLVASVAISAVVVPCLLWLGARWFKIPDVTLRRALWATVLFTAVAVPLQFVSIAFDLENQNPALAILVLIVMASSAVIVIRRVFRTTFGRAILVWLIATIGNTALAFALAFGVKGVLLESFSIPTNGMAPTILGDHFEVPCPHCGKTMIVSAAYTPGSIDARGICTSCLQTAIVPVPEAASTPGDHIMVMKLLKANRWDLVVFKTPADPTVVHVDRLVGLPGEEVAIRDGEVFINGKLIQKPAEIAALKYAASPMDPQQTEWGPVRLGDDEYFVLGDFSLSSLDSRAWPEGAPGRPSYAVPESHLVGVVTHIYRPFARWRVFR